MQHQLQATIPVFVNISCSEPQDAPTLNGQQVLPFSVALEVFQKFPMPLPAVYLDGQLMLGQGNVDPKSSPRNNAIKFSNSGRKTI